jgi:hypothetical protein
MSLYDVLKKRENDKKIAIIDGNEQVSYKLPR